MCTAISGSAIGFTHPSSEAAPPEASSLPFNR